MAFLAAMPALAAGCNSSFSEIGDGHVLRGPCNKAPECQESITVASDSPALIVTDPAALEALPLKDVLEKLLEDTTKTSPQKLIAMMFDTNNTEESAVFKHLNHCDNPDNSAHKNGPAATCPRSEGALALSDGFFTPGHPDHFYPVAAVNRFDLTPLDHSTCGEYRIVYAKESGKTDPNNRVFLIFEAAFMNQKNGCLQTCRPVAEFWKGLEKAKDANDLGKKLRQFFLEGVGDLQPAISRRNFTTGTSGSEYYGQTGQIRLSQHMDQHLELREFSFIIHFDGPRLAPRPVGNNPKPSLFTATGGPSASPFQEDFIDTNLEMLARPDVVFQGMTTGVNSVSGESALGGDAVNDYAARAEGNVPLHDHINQRIKQKGLGAGCAADDRLDSGAILRRITAQSCAGCHAPTQLLGEERKIGCGVTWPNSLGEVHIDEHGNLSPALKEVFLPHRADYMQTFLQGCDNAAVEANVGGPFGDAALTQ